MISSGLPHPDFMGRAIRVALVALVVSVSAAPHVSAQQELTFSLFERYVESLRVQANIPGMSAAIVQNERVVWNSGFGFADVEHAIRARSDTPYHVAGLTEALSSAILLEQCVETGHASLDERIQQRVSSYGDSDATMRDLLAHRSPNGGFKYDQGRYAALTPLAEACVGKGTPFRQAIWEKVLYRLNMFDSVPAQNVEDESADDRVQFSAGDLDRFSNVLKRLAVPYRVNGSSVAVNSSVPKGVDAATGAISTVRDLAKFDNALNVAGALLNRDTLNAMWSNQPGTPTGLGWFVQNYNGQTLYWQFGNIPGAYSSLILKVPSRRLTLILLANSDGLSAPFPLQDGDVNASLFARTFLRLFVA